jgi:hypothetical protein
MACTRTLPSPLQSAPSLTAAATVLTTARKTCDQTRSGVDVHARSGIHGAQRARVGRVSARAPRGGGDDLGRSSGPPRHSARCTQVFFLGGQANVIVDIFYEEKGAVPPHSNVSDASANTLAREMCCFSNAVLPHRNTRRDSRSTCPWNSCPPSRPPN